jgi:sugar lactone lactonase YvrE
VRRRLVLPLLLVALLGTVEVASAQPRPRWDTRVLALVPKPGFPAHAYVHPNGRVYAGTYDNPSGDTVPSRVFEYDGGDGTLIRSWSMEGQDLSGPHGVQAATSDARGRIVLLDKSPPRIMLLDLRTGAQIPYASFERPSIPNYAAWGPDGSLYVTDYGRPILWRVPPGGGAPEQWLADPRLDGGEFGTTGIELEANRTSLLVSQQSEAGGAAGNPTTGRIWRVPIGADGKAGAMTQFWESQPVDGPDGFGIAKSGNVYIANLASNQIVAIGPNGEEIERFPAGPGGDNGSPVPFDAPSNVSFLGTRAIVAQQSYFTGTAANQAILDVETGEEGLPELIPFNAGLKDAVRPSVKPATIDGRRRTLTLTLSEPAEVEFLTERRDGRRWVELRRTFHELSAKRHVLSLLKVANKTRLRPALHRVTMIATDAAGNVSSPVRRVGRIR